MAELYLALLRRDFGFEKLVALKSVHPSLRSERMFMDMLLNEARVAATLSHPNIAQIFDVGEAEGTYFIAMEYVNGVDLRSVFQSATAQQGGGLPLNHALLIGVQVLSGLGYAHDKRNLMGDPLRIVHRDVSPANVIISDTGDVKLIDFGIAKSRDQLGERTGSGQLKGKLSYMAPEQAMCQPIDRRSDIFSFGILFYELTTGRRLFKGDSDVETLQRVVSGNYPSPSSMCPGYPPELEAIVLKALSFDPNTRYQRAEHMQHELEQFARRAGLELSPLGLARWVAPVIEESGAAVRNMLDIARGLGDSFRPALDSIPQAAFALTQPAHGSVLVASRDAAGEARQNTGITQVPAPRRRIVAPTPQPAARMRLPSAHNGKRRIRAAAAPAAPVPTQGASESQRLVQSTVPLARNVVLSPARPRPARRPARYLLGTLLLLVALWTALDREWLPVPPQYQGHLAAARSFETHWTGRLRRWAESTSTRALVWVREDAPLLSPGRAVLEVQIDHPDAVIRLDGKRVEERVIEGLVAHKSYRMTIEAKGYPPRHLYVTATPPRKVLKVVVEPRK